MLIESRRIKLTTRTGVEVKRTLPHAKLKMIGAWCFVDHFGPTRQTDAMVVAAHPHTGLQTVTWLIEGEVEHRDSIGSIQKIKPGQLNLMTAGYGIAHSELSLSKSADGEISSLHAVQLWIALPKADIDVAPEFEHQANLPKLQLAEGVAVTVLVGEFEGVRAETKIFSPLLGLELRVKAGHSVEIALNQGFEHGFLLAEGQIAINGANLPVSGLEYLEIGAKTAKIEAFGQDSVVLLLGGKPFGEKILMWWNFIGRSHDDIVEARNQWNDHRNQGPAARFGQFEDQVGGWIPAPELPSVRLHPR
jgi:redox-sensitive bicupin YhaK (pirin superfamily)